MINSTQEAIALLENTRLSEHEREGSVHYLRDHPSPEGDEALIAALDDDDAGVRWAAGAALAELGDDAFPALLNKLAHKSNDTWLREGARHVIHYNSSSRVRAESGELMRALKGPAADIASMEAAYKLLRQWK
jgi:HEAT repeat protein